MPPSTEQVQSSTNQYRLILTQFHQVPTSSALYWPSATKYQPIFERISNCRSFFQLDVISIHIRGRVWPGLPVIFYSGNSIVSWGNSWCPFYISYSSSNVCVNLLSNIYITGTFLQLKFNHEMILNLWLTNNRRLFRDCESWVERGIEHMKWINASLDGWNKKNQK